MVRPRVYPDELRERAVRLLHEWRQARGVSEGGFTAIAGQLGLQRETLRRWVLEAEGMDPYRPGAPKVMTARDERARLAELERENRELRRANEILKTAAAFMPIARLCRRRWAAEAIGAGQPGWGGLAVSA